MNEIPKFIRNNGEALYFNYKGITFYIITIKWLGHPDVFKEIHFKTDENYFNALKENSTLILEVYNLKNNSRWFGDIEDYNYIERIMMSGYPLNQSLFGYKLYWGEGEDSSYEEGFDLLIRGLDNPYLGSGYKDIIKKFIENPRNVPKPPKPPYIPTPGYIYLIESLNYYKIGKSKNFTSRTKHLNTIMPIETTLIHSFHSLDYTKAEKFLHNKYQHLHHKGEWFSLTDQEVNEIKAIQDDII
jgi:hypothetical protein